MFLSRSLLSLARLVSNLPIFRDNGIHLARSMGMTYATATDGRCVLKVLVGEPRNINQRQYAALELTTEEDFDFVLPKTSVASIQKEYKKASEKADGCLAHAIGLQTNVDPENSTRSYSFSDGVARDAKIASKITPKGLTPQQYPVTEAHIPTSPQGIKIGIDAELLYDLVRTGLEAIGRDDRSKHCILQITGADQPIKVLFGTMEESQIVGVIMPIAYPHLSDKPIEYKAT